MKKLIVLILLEMLVVGCNRTSNSNLLLKEQEITDAKEIIIKRNLSESASASISSMKIYSKSEKIKKVGSLGVEVVRVPENATLETALEELRANSNIEYAEPNYKRKMSISDDVFKDYKPIDIKEELLKNFSLDKQSKIFSASTFFNDPDIKLQYALESVEAEKAWKINEGNQSVIVAVTDTGADLNHPDLKDNLVQGFTAINGTTSPNDDNGHGTHVSGIISAISNNQKGGVGLAPKCKVMPIKVLAASGQGNDSDIAEGIVWAVDHGAKIINMSLGGPEEGKTLENAMKYAYNSNVLVVAAMGNNGKKIKNYPASYKNIIAVGATNEKNQIASFSNFGDWISVSSPGFKIYSTFPSYKVDLSKLGLTANYTVLSGTSMSTPYVSALAALVWSKNLNMSRADVRKKIEKNSFDLDKKGFDELSGFGLISAYKSLLN